MANHRREKDQTRRVPTDPTQEKQYLCRHMPEWIRVTLMRYAQVHDLPSAEDAIYHICERSGEFRLLWTNLRNERIQAGILKKSEGLTEFMPPVPAVKTTPT